jgi:hypothetical protein
MLDVLVGCSDGRQDLSGEEIRRDIATDVAGEASLAIGDQREDSGWAENHRGREVSWMLSECGLESNERLVR